jgi:hypothetical protein
MLVGKLKETEALAGQIERAMNAPQLVFRLRGGPSFQNIGGIDNAD